MTPALAQHSAEVQEQGFAVIPDILNCTMIASLSDELSRATLRRSRAGVRHVLGLSAVSSVARSKPLIDIVRKILGCGAIPFRATLFEKSPAANWLIVWHQDTALPLEKRRNLPGWGPWSFKDEVLYAHAPASVLEDVLALRVHLDDSTAENGPLRVLPGTHKLGVLSDDAIHELSTRTQTEECVVPKGGIVAMRPLIIHASSKSQTNHPRRVLHIEYAASPSIASPLEIAVV